MNCSFRVNIYISIYIPKFQQTMCDFEALQNYISHIADRKKLWKLNEQYISLLLLFFWPCCTACEILIPQPGIEPVTLQWKHGVLITGLPGKSLTNVFPRAFWMMVNQVPFVNLRILSKEVCSLILSKGGYIHDYLTFR